MMADQHGKTSHTKRLTPTRVLALSCALLLLAGILPLYAIAFYNHPYYDDYGFSAQVRGVWLQTQNAGQVLSAAVQSARHVRATWQGTYTGTFLSNLQPGVFAEGLYGLTTFFLLTAYLVCFGFLLWTLLRHVLQASPAQAVSIASLILFVSVQFLPAVNEAFYWFNGGVGNIFIYSLLALAIALLLRLSWAKRGYGLSLALLGLTVLLGGGSYGGGLLGILLFTGFSALAFRYQNRFRFVYAAFTLCFLLCFLYNVSAPGNALRAQAIGQGLSPVEAVARSLYYGVALFGDYFTLPVAALALGLSPFLYKLAKQSRFSFPRPALVFLLGFLLFCTQLTPPLYAGVFLGGERAYNTYYVSFLILLLTAETYALGAFARKRERSACAKTSVAPAAARHIAMLAVCLFAIGCLGHKPVDEVLYGPMHTAGGSALLSLVRGEAKTYHEQMLARETLLNDASLPVVTLAPLTAVPPVFMEDLLRVDAVYDVAPILARYYGKEAVLLEGGDSQ